MRNDNLFFFSFTVTWESPVHVCSKNKVVLECSDLLKQIIVLQLSFTKMSMNECKDLKNYQPAEPSNCDKDLQALVTQE